MYDKELIAAFVAAMHNDNQKKETDIRKESEDFGNELYQSYLGFKDAGFTDEQAFKILLTILGGNE